MTCGIKATPKPLYKRNTIHLKITQHSLFHYSVLDKLFVISDYIRFGAVCKSWNSLSKKHYKEKRILQNNHQLPWLHLLCTITGEHTEKLMNLYNITTGEISKFQFCRPINTHDLTCCGSSYMDKFSLFVFNPLSGTVIRLPEFDRHPFWLKHFGTVVCQLNKGGGRYALSGDPSLGPFEVLATSYFYEAVAHLNSSDGSWTYSETKNKCHFYKFIFYKGHKLSVNSYGKIMLLDVISGKCINMKQIASSPVLPMNTTLCDSLEPYFVENTSGDLLLFHRYYSFICPAAETYKIYKLMIHDDSKEVEYVPIVNLGGDSFFLGTFHCVSVLAVNYPGCLPNSIYCADHRGFKVEGNKWNSIEVCNLNIDEIERFSSVCIPDGYFKVALTTWFVMAPKF